MVHGPIAGQFREPVGGFRQVGPGPGSDGRPAHRGRQHAQRHLPAVVTRGRAGRRPRGRPAGEQQRQRPARPGWGRAVAAAPQPWRHEARPGRPARVLAAGTEICCPSTARTASSKPSYATGHPQTWDAPRPAARATSSAASAAAIACGSASRSNKLPAPGHHLADAAQAREPDPQQDMGLARYPRDHGKKIGGGAPSR